MVLVTSRLATDFCRQRMNFSITGMCIITFKLVFLPRHKKGLKKTNGILEPSFEIPS